MTYDELCTAVGKIDKAAEQYMRTDVKELESFAGDNYNPHLLMGAFVWEVTPQGHEYWSDIHHKLT